jgi:hypothetical protein
MTQNPCGLISYTDFGAHSATWLQPRKVVFHKQSFCRLASIVHLLCEALYTLIC